jgi:hypothetical protein
VYASEKALNMQRHALPKALDVCPRFFSHVSGLLTSEKNFVRWDNAAFRAELPQSQSEIDTQSPIQTEDSQSFTSSQVGPSSPGKRKYLEEDPITGRVVSARRGRAGSASVGEREVRGSNESLSVSGSSSVDSVGTVTRDIGGMEVDGGEGEMIIGVDPTLLDSSNSPPLYQGHGNVNGKAKELEMQERSGMPMVIGRPLVPSTMVGASASTIDSMDMNMDLDQVIQRDENVREESAAVKRVGFVE